MEAAKSVDLAPVVAAADATKFSGKVLVWECIRDPAGGIGIVREQGLRSYVQKGGSLILTISHTPGPSAMKIASISPTTAWYTQIISAFRGGPAGFVKGVEWDPEMYDAGRTLSIPYHFKLQPVSAVERGMGRYERFAWTIPFINQPSFPGRTFWTRYLMNRDWRVRVKGDDINASALVLTGRFGAGRVAVLAAGVMDLKTGKGDANFWIPLLKWMAASPANSTGEPVDVRITPLVTVDREKRTLDVAVRNPTSSPLKVTVIARLETWEQAYVGDVEQELTIPASGAATANLAVPAIGPMSYQALDYQDKWDARVGILSETGATSLGEIRLPVDLEPAVRLSLATDELGSQTYPYEKAPGPDTLFFRDRMGAPINTYSYAPGASAHAILTVSNGAKNLAPLSKAEDETTSSNKSLMAINDGDADAGKTPRGIQSYGMWVGQAGTENILKFTLPDQATINSVTLNGCPGINPSAMAHNPGAAMIEVDGKEVARAMDLDSRFKTGGLVTLRFPAIAAQAVEIRLPWLNDGTPELKRIEPWLAEVEINGWIGKAPADIQGHFKAQLKDSLTGEVIPLGEKEVRIKGGESEVLSLPFKVPELNGKAARYLTLEGTFQTNGLTEGELNKEMPLLVIQPEHPLTSLDILRGENNLGLTFIVTRGFRNADKIGTGTQEISSGWSQPDDMVWAYSRNLEQIGSRASTEAGRFYLSDASIDRFANPWTSYLDGESYFGAAAPRLVKAVKESKKWDRSDTVTFGFSDRWDSGPAVNAMYDWQELVSFDEYLKANQLPGLQGRTRGEVIQDITANHMGRFRSWQLDHYSNAVKTMCDAFARENKRLVISGQGIPIVPQAQEAGLSQTICGMNDDETWGMQYEDPCYSTGKQMGYMAMNPSWRLSTLLAWGYNSAVLNNPNWWSPVGTTEPSRRHYYDRAWRATFDTGGHYHSIHAFGYSANAYTSCTMSPNDWQEWWRLEERHSLLSPDGPFGAGVVVSTAQMSDPDKTDFSGGGTGGSPADGSVARLAQAIRVLHERGIDISFSTNAAALDKLPGNPPLIILNLSEFAPSEIAALQKLAARGVRMVAFQGSTDLSPDAAKLFGATPDAFHLEPLKPGERRTAPATPLIQENDKTMLIGGTIDAFNESRAKAMAAAFQTVLQLPVQFPIGAAGYGFTMGSQHYIVVEDWREEARVLSVRYHPDAPVKSIHAVNINDNRTLAVHRGKDDWLIDLPTRPGDGSLICVEEEK